MHNVNEKNLCSTLHKQVRKKNKAFPYPQAMEAWVAVEELHLLGWQRAQHLLNGEELVNLTLSREQGLPITQLPQDTAHRPHIHSLAIRSSVKRKENVCHPLPLPSYWAAPIYWAYFPWHTSSQHGKIKFVIKKTASKNKPSVSALDFLMYLSLLEKAGGEFSSAPRDLVLFEKSYTRIIFLTAKHPPLTIKLPLTSLLSRGHAWTLFLHCISCLLCLIGGWAYWVWPLGEQKFWEIFISAFIHKKIN